MIFRSEFTYIESAYRPLSQTLGSNFAAGYHCCFMLSLRITEINEFQNPVFLFTRHGRQYMVLFPMRCFSDLSNKQ